MAIVHRFALAALLLACTSNSPVGAIPPGRAGGGIAAIFTRNVASSSSSSTASTQPTSSSSTASVGTNAQPSNRKKDSVPYLQQYLRDWVKTEVPVADNEGHLCLNPPSATGDSVVGREAANKREKVPYNSIKNKNLRKFYTAAISTLFLTPSTADIEGWDDVSKVRNHSWRERARILKYHGVTQFGKEGDQIARLEEHLCKIGTAKKGTKRRK